jgi:hypothetical protein
MYFFRRSARTGTALTSGDGSGDGPDGWTTKGKFGAQQTKETTLGKRDSRLKDKEIIGAKLGEKGYTGPKLVFAA